MTLSMYDVSIPVFLRCLNNVASVLEKGGEDAANRKINPDIFAKARLYPDMFCLSEQIKFMTINAANGGARLAGLEPPAFAFTPDEGTYEGAKERVRKTIDFLQGLKREQIDGSEGRDVSFVNFAQKKMEFKGLGFLLDFALPNVFFHYSMTYAILRENGVTLGKSDFLG